MTTRAYRLSPVMRERLVVVETEEAYWLARAEDPSDWLISFSKSGGDAAGDWARRAARLHNEALARATRESPDRCDDSFGEVRENPSDGTRI